MRRKLLCAAGLLAALVWVTNARADLTQFRGYQAPDRGPVNGAPSLDGEPYGYKVNGLDPGAATPADYATGRYSLTCAGSDLWGNGDSGCFAYDPNPVVGDFTAIVRSVSINDAATTWGRTGIQARADVDAANSPNVYVYRMSGGPGAVVNAPSEPIQTRIHQRYVYTTPADDNGASTPLQVIDAAPGPLTPIWLALHRVGSVYVGQSAPDIGGGPGAWSAPQIMAGSVANRGPVYVGLGHQAHEQDRGARNNTAQFEQFVVGDFIPELLPPSEAILPPDPLPGPSGGNMTWGIREVRDLGGSGSIQAAYAKLASGAGTIVDGTAPVINHNDPNTNGAGSGLITPDRPFLTNDIHSPGEDDNDIQMVAHGRVLIPAGMGGLWTFGTHSDDGFALRVWDATTGNQVPWELAYGNGTVDYFNGRQNLAHPAPTGDSNTRGVINLQGGRAYNLEYLAYEDGGGAYWELYAAKGEHSTDGETGDWRLVGHKAAAPNAKPGVASDGWIVVQNPPGSGGALNNFAQANAAIDAALAGGTAVIADNVPSVNYRDSNSGASHSFGGDLEFPGNTPGDDDDYAIRAFAQLVIPLDGNYRIGFRGDDGGYVRITGGPDGNGGNFSAILTNATGASQIQENGDLLICDCLTGDSNTLAETFLAAGTYDIQAGFFERGGGSSFEVFGSGPGTGLMLLMSNGAAVIADVDGLQLIPEPSTYVLAALGVAFAMLIRRRRK